MFAAVVLFAAETAEAAGLPQFDASTFPSQLFWLAITFGVLYLLMAYVFLPRIGGTLEERRDRIADDLDKAAEQRRMAEEAEDAYNRSLADARAKARAIAAETHDEIGAEIDEMRKEAEEGFAEKAKDAEARIDAMKSTAAAKVREAATETTRAIVEALIRETPTDAVVSAAVAKAAKA